MYKLPYFTEEEPAYVFDFMQKNSFAIIVGHDGDFPVATHVPLDVRKNNEQIILTGHMMKNTDHHKAFLKNENVLVIFNGPHSYVSASWYANKKNVASTWNYIDVHAKGKITFSTEDGTKKIIENITDKYEPEESEAAFNKLPGEYVNKLVKVIIGFKIEVSVLENVFKLSQNHDLQTRENIIQHLLQSDDDGAKQIAVEMTRKLSE